MNSVFSVDLNSYTALMSRLFWKWTKEKRFYRFVGEYVVKCGAYLLKRIDQFEQAREPAAHKVVEARHLPAVDR